MKRTFSTLILFLLVLTVSAQKYHYHDDFIDNSKNWNVDKDNESNTYIKDGRYYFSFSVDAMSNWNMFKEHAPITLSSSKNYISTIKASGVLKSDEDNFGIRFSAAGPSIDSLTGKTVYRNIYAFLLRKDGYAAVLHSGPDKAYTIVVDWTKVTKPYTGKDIVFSMENKGDIFTFSINGKKAMTTNIDIPNGYSDIGFNLGGKATMSVDWLDIKEK